MTVAELIETLAAHGTQLWFEGDRLRFRAPRGVISDDQRAFLAANRDAVRAMLRSQAASAIRFAPLSYGQRSLWFVNQDEPASAAYNVAFVVRVSSQVDRDAMRQALQAVVDRHAILRTTYEIVDDRPHQRIVGAATAAFEIVEAGEIDEAELQARVDANYRRPFDLERGPVLRATLFTRRPSDHVLLLTAHHIAVDGWSLLILLDEFSKLYIEATGGPAAGLQKPDVDYVDYVSWQQDMLTGSDGERLAGFWHDTLAAPRSEIELPADRPHPARKSVAGATFDFEIGSELSAKLGELARAEGTTLFVVLLAAFKALLFRYTGTEDVVVGTPAFGRSKLEFTRILGHFVNPLPLRTEVTGDLQFRQLMVTVRRTLLSALDAQEYPLPLMVERLQPVRDLSRSPLFETMFVLQRFEHFRELSGLLVATASTAEVEFAGLTCRPYPLRQQEGQFDLGLGLVEEGDSLTGAIKYNTDLFDLATVHGIANHYRALLRGIVADPGMSVGALPIMDADERQGLIDSAGQFRAAVAPASTLHERFEAQVARTPNAVAATCEGVQLTYDELNVRANRVAHRLRALGVGPDALVGLCIDRSLDLVVGLLGIVKAGGAYLPIDLSYPADRIQFMLEDAQARVIVTDRALEGKLPADTAIRLFIDDDFSAEPISNPVSAVTADDLIYVIYTSGSTGRPKGTMLTHRAVDRLFQSTHAWYEFGTGDVWTLFHSAAFDFSVWEFWGALIYGGRLVVVPYWVSRSPDAFLDLLHREGVTVLNQTPSAFRQLIQADLATGIPRSTTLRWVIFGGEALELQSLRPWFDRHGDRGPVLVNMYGITETCVHVTYRPISLADLNALAGSVIGVPIPDLRVHVLEASREPSPIGVPGEMYVGGPGLARGYLNRADLTAERFVPDPFVAGERLYRTGDLARRLASGDIEYLGRIDQQVKIRGFRIELGEIEAALGTCEDVHQCVVVVRDDGASNKRLVAYVVASGGHGAVVSRIRSRLGEVLPDYMVPSGYVFLDALPLTSNGKVDRRALPAPETLTTGERRDLEPLETEIEKRLGAIWCEVLQVSEVGRADNFFELGGHSMLATQVAARVRRELQCECPLRTVFEHPALSDLAGWIERAVSTTQARQETSIPRTDDELAPTSFMQERLWFVHQIAPQSDAYNIPVAFRLNGAVDVELLSQALDAVVARHEILRTTYVPGEEFPRQRVDADARVPLEFVDLRSRGGAAWSEAVRLAESSGGAPFDLARGPVLRATLIQTGRAEFLLTLSQHHIASDQRSLELMCRDWSAAYNALRSGTVPELAAPATRYRDFASWQRSWLKGDRLSEQLSYWRTQLKGLRPLPLPTDHPYPLNYSYRGSLEIEALPETLIPGLQQAGRSMGATLFMTLAATFAVMLRKMCGRDDIAFAIPIANRGLQALEDVIGPFVNTLVLRAQCPEELSFNDLVNRVRDAALDAYAHQEIPFEKLVDELRPSRDAGRPVLAQVFFNLQQGQSGDLRLASVASEQILLKRQAAQFELSLTVLADAPAAIAIEYSTDLFTATTIRALLDRYVVLLQAIATSAATTIAELPFASVGVAKVGEPIAELLQRLRSLDIQLSLNGDRLKISVPKGAIDDAIRATIAARKDDIIESLRTSPISGSRERAELKRILRIAPLPLSSAQQRLWFLDRMDPGRSHYNVGLGLRLRGPLDAAAIQQALREIVSRHESLRTRFDELDGVPHIEILVAAEPALDIVDLSALPAAVRDAEALRLSADCLRMPFDLSKGHLARFLLTRLKPEEHVLTMCAHHIVCDGWSLGIMIDEVCRFYEGLTSGRAAEMRPLAVQYADYAAWQRGQLQSGSLSREMKYWKQQLAGAPSLLELPTDRPRPTVPSFRGGRTRHFFDLPILPGLKATSRRHDATLFMVLLAAWQVLLHRRSGQDDIVVGSPFANRDVPAVEGLIGCFVNNVVLRSTLSDNPTFEQFLAAVRKTTLDAFDHRDLPFDVLVDGLRPERSASHAPVFQVLFALQSFPADFLPPPGLSLEIIEPHTAAARFDLSVEIADYQGRLSAAYEYATDLFDAESIASLHKQFERLLQELTGDAGCRVDDIELLTIGEQRLLLDEWNATDIAFERQAVHRLLEAAARAHPDAIAVVAGSTSVNYRQLDERANQLAHLLVGTGVRPGDLVAVCVDRTIDMPIAIAAVLKAGAAYVPLDPTHPADRLRFTLEDAGVVCVITLSEYAALLGERKAPLLLLDNIEPEVKMLPVSPVGIEVSADALAYVIYTSGSTGRPKGVQVEHRNVVAFLGAMQRQPGFASSDVLLAVTTLSFDIAGLEFWLPLSCGGKVVIASRTDVLDGEKLADMMSSHRISVMQATPATWRLLLDSGWQGKSDLRILCGGEAMPRELAAALVGKVREVWNMYGPTETTIWSTLSRVEDVTRAIPIGRPIANTRVFVLEKSGQLAPIGISGELCIGGAGVARGYRNRDELTAEKFVDLELPNGRRERVYRTGDVVRFRNDGQLEFIGRRDHQVKVRGYRIELEEIEAVLAGHANVRQSVVCVREDTPGDQRLVGYVITEGSSEFDAEAARATLRRALPEYMVPNHLMILEALPLTPNGKVDRRALPAPQVATVRHDAPDETLMSAEQRRVAKIWRDLLGIERVGLYENFFDLGGHSLLLVKLQAGLKREFSAELPLVELFQRTTVAAQADRLSTAGPTSAALQRAHARALRQLHD